MAVHECTSLMLLRLRRAWRHSAARRCARLPAGSPSCEGYVLTGSHAQTGRCSLSRNRRSKDRHLAQRLSCKPRSDRVHHTSWAAEVLAKAGCMLAACARHPRAQCSCVRVCGLCAFSFGRGPLGLDGQLWRAAMALPEQRQCLVSTQQVGGA